MVAQIEHNPNPQTVHTPIARVPQSAVPSLTLRPKARLFKQLNHEIPNNDYGLPEFYYRCDLLPNDLLDLPAEEQAPYLDAATIELDYSQGFPATLLGEPFWAQLPHETADAYRAFTSFLDLPSRDPFQSSKKNIAASPVRQLHLLKTELGISDGADLVEMSYIYYWHVRAKAYDIFRLASHGKKREQRLMTIEDEHFQLSSDYLMLATDWLNAMFQDPETHQLKPKDVMDFFVKMIQVQRLSSGVSPFANPTGKEGSGGIPANATLEVILRTIAQQMNGGQPANGGGGGREEANLQDLTRKLLAGDGNDLAKAQELIIRVNGAGEGRTRNLAPVSDEGHI